MQTAISSRDSTHKLSNTPRIHHVSLICVWAGTNDTDGDQSAKETNPPRFACLLEQQSDYDCGPRRVKHGRHQLTLNGGWAKKPKLPANGYNAFQRVWIPKNKHLYSSTQVTGPPSLCDPSLSCYWCLRLCKLHVAEHSAKLRVTEAGRNGLKNTPTRLSLLSTGLGSK